MSDLTERDVYLRLIDAIRTAAGCAQQLAHLRKDLRWLRVRDVLEGMVNRLALLAARKAA